MSFILGVKQCLGEWFIGVREPVTNQGTNRDSLKFFAETGRQIAVPVSLPVPPKVSPKGLLPDLCLRPLLPTRIYQHKLLLYRQLSDSAWSAAYQLR